MTAADLSAPGDSAKYVDLWRLLHEWEELKKKKSSLHSIRSRMNFLMKNDCCFSILEMYLFEEEKWNFDSSDQTVGISLLNLVCCLNSIPTGCC